MEGEWPEAPLTTFADLSGGFAFKSKTRAFPSAHLMAASAYYGSQPVQPPASSYASDLPVSNLPIGS